MKKKNTIMFALDDGTRDGLGRAYEYNSIGLATLSVDSEKVKKMMEHMGAQCSLIVELNYANGIAKKGLEFMRDGWCSQNGAAAVDEAVTLFENITKKTISSYRKMVYNLAAFSDKILGVTESNEIIAPNYRYDESTKVDYQVVGLLKYNGSNLISAVKFDLAKEQFKLFQDEIQEHFSEMVKCIEKDAYEAFIPAGYEDDKGGLQQMYAFIDNIRAIANKSATEIISDVGEIISQLNLKLQEKDQDVLDAISYGNQIYPGN